MSGEKWLPIESARPEADQEVLVGYWHKRKFVWRVAVFQLGLDTEVGSGDHYVWRFLTKPGDWHVTPTHWMPLPPPPTSGGVREPMGDVKLPRLEPAIRTLIYYVKMANERAGNTLVGDCLAELEGVRETFEKYDETVRALLSQRDGGK